MLGIPEVLKNLSSKVELNYKALVIRIYFIKTFKSLDTLLNSCNNSRDFSYIIMNINLKLINMKKYTIIYAEYFRNGSHSNSITRMKHIECEPLQLNEVVEAEVGFSLVWFILDGHCQETTD